MKVWDYKNTYKGTYGQTIPSLTAYIPMKDVRQITFDQSGSKLLTISDRSLRIWNLDVIGQSEISLLTPELLFDEALDSVPLLTHWDPTFSTVKVVTIGDTTPELYTYSFDLDRKQIYFKKHTL